MAKSSPTCLWLWLALAAAIVLAADALSSTSRAAGLFRGEGLWAGLDLAESHCSPAASDGCTAGRTARG